MKENKVVAGVGGGILAVVFIIAAGSAMSRPVAGPTAGSGPASNPAVAAPPAAPGGNIPDLTGKGLPSAQTILRTAGFTAVTAHDSSNGGRMQFNDPNWKVCFQDPAPGQYPAGTPIDLGVVKRAEACPLVDGTAAGKLGATPAG